MVNLLQKQLRQLPDATTPDIYRLSNEKSIMDEFIILRTFIRMKP